jgi:hypothetical protein
MAESTAVLNAPENRDHRYNAPIPGTDTVPPKRKVGRPRKETHSGTPTPKNDGNKLHNMQFGTMDAKTLVPADPTPVAEVPTTPIYAHGKVYPADLGFTPGRPWHYGDPVPQGSIVVSHETGVNTLELEGDRRHDPLAWDKFVIKLDEVFRLAQEPPSESRPDGLRPWRLIVNAAFKKHCQAHQWGDTEENTANIQHVGHSDQLWQYKNGGPIVEQYPYRARFITGGITDNQGAIDYQD